MNRLSCLIRRRVGRWAPVAAWPAPAFEWRDYPHVGAADAKLFAMTWAGGFVVFTTFLS